MSDPASTTIYANGTERPIQSMSAIEIILTAVAPCLSLKNPLLLPRCSDCVEMLSEAEYYTE